MPDYSGGCAIVIATTSEKAKKLLFDEYVESQGHPPQEQGQKQIEEDYHNLREPEVMQIKKGIVLYAEGGA